MITKNELQQIDYAEFGNLMDRLTSDIAASGVEFDIVAPILRSGGFTGLHLAAKLRIMNTFPLQYKSFAKPTPHIDTVLEMPALTRSLSTEPKILVADTNTISGNTARRAIADIRTVFPDARIYYATALMDVSTQLDTVEQIFVGAYSNEARSLSIEEASARGIENRITIFPWENIDEQWTEINAYQR